MTNLAAVLFCSAHPAGSVGQEYSYADQVAMTSTSQQTCVFQGTTHPPARNRALTSSAVRVFHMFYRSEPGPYKYWGAMERVTWTLTLHAPSGRHLPTVTLTRSPQGDLLPPHQPIPISQCVTDFYLLYPRLRNQGIWHTAVFAALLRGALGHEPTPLQLPPIAIDGPHTRGIYVFDLSQPSMLRGADYAGLPDPAQPAGALAPDVSESEGDSDVQIVDQAHPDVEAGETNGSAFVFPYVVEATREPVTEVTVTVRGQHGGNPTARSVTRSFPTADLLAGSVTVTLI